MDILGSKTKKNNGTPRAMDMSPRSYVSVYQFDMFVRLNPEINPMHQCGDGRSLIVVNPTCLRQLMR